MGEKAAKLASPCALTRVSGSNWGFVRVCVCVYVGFRGSDSKQAILALVGYVFKTLC